MITIYTSNTTRDAANYVMDLLRHVDKTNLSVMHTVIVPDRASLEAERALLGAVGGSFNAQVKTFRRLAADILPKFSYLSKQAGIMALTGLIQDNRHRLVCYTKGVDTPGFVADMYDTISMLKYCRIAPQRLRDSNLPQGVRSKAQDIALLYEQYVAFAQDRFVDSADKMELLAQSVSTSQTVQNSYFYVYDFDNLSAQEVAIVEQLMLHAKGVTIACCASHTGDRMYLNDIYQSVLAVAQRNGLSVNVVNGGSHVNKQTQQIGEHLYRYHTVAPMENGGFAELYQGATRVAEVYALACRIQRYVRQGGRFKDIYVVASDVNNYANAITTVFPQFEIPYFCDRQFLLADHPYARFVLDYLTLQRNNGKLSCVLPFVKNYLFCGIFEDDVCQNDGVFQFENYCLKYNVSYRYDNFTLGKEDPYFAEAQAFAEQFNQVYKQFSFPNCATVADYAQMVRDLIAHTDLTVKNIAFATQQQTMGLDFESKVTAQAHQKFAQVLEQAQTVCGERFVKLDEFVRLLAAGVEAVKISVIPVHSDSVIFANMAKARKHDIKFLALLGANYGVMPIVKADCKLLNDGNIKDLALAGINVEPQIFTENKRERFSLLQLLQEATQKLYVSCCASDGGATLTPSPFVVEMGSLFTQNGQPLAPTNTTDEEVYTVSQAVAKVIRNNRRIKDNQIVNMPAYTLLKDKFAAETAKYAFVKDGRNVRVSRGAELYLKGDRTSVSQLTDFYNCPYRFYVQYGLNVKPRTVSQLQTADLGNILHAVMEHYVLQMDVAETDATTEQKAVACFDLAMSDDFYRGLAKDPKMQGVLASLKAESIKMCKVVKGQFAHSQFVNLQTEMEFGTKNGYPAVQVHFDGGKFNLVGKIDRVDVCDGRFIVLDYKSGAAATYTEKDLYVGHKMQLLVYLRAAADATNYAPAGFYYFNMHNNFTEATSVKQYSFNGRTLNDFDVACQLDDTLVGGKSEKLNLKLNKDGKGISKQNRNLLTAEQFHNQTEYAFELIRRAGKLMTQGYAAVSPYEGACKYCDYKGICDFGDLFNYNARKVTQQVSANSIDTAVHQDE